MTKLIIMRLSEAEAERLSKTDWEFSIGHGVRIPQVLTKFENRLREAVEEARNVGSQTEEDDRG